jgi:hypothetical protein
MRSTSDEFTGKGLWLYVHALGHIFTRKKPVKTLEDLKGTNSPRIPFRKALRYSVHPVGIPVPEVYNVLKGAWLTERQCPRRIVVLSSTGCRLWHHLRSLHNDVSDRHEQSEVGIPIDARKTMEDNWA